MPCGRRRNARGDRSNLSHRTGQAHRGPGPHGANVGLAGGLAQAALVVSLSERPRTAVPANPGAWLMAVAKRRAIDALRRGKMRERKHQEIARTLNETDEMRGAAAAAIEAAMDDDLGDELLGLIFT